MEVTDWLSKKDKKEVEIIRQNFKERQGVVYEKRVAGGTGVLPLCQNKPQKKI